MKRRKRSIQIENYILENIRQHSSDIVKLVSKKFKMSRQSAYRHVVNLVDKNFLTAKGTTRNRVYLLKSLDSKIEIFEKIENLEEDKIWREEFKYIFSNSEKNVRDIAQYAFSEILNNAIVHSESDFILIQVEKYPDIYSIEIVDEGIGIFNKIQKEYNLDDSIQAIMELSKGKLTTNPEKHTGEGIFFTTRAVDSFAIFSGNLWFSCANDNFDLISESKDEISVKGTTVFMEIINNTSRTLQSVFNGYSTNENPFSFDRTFVPVFLAKYGDENLISRSQARRLLTRFDRFKEVVLDFDKVSLIGQAFADEIFRVYKSMHPNINLYAINTNEEIRNMIRRILGDQAKSILADK